MRCIAVLCNIPAQALAHLAADGAVSSEGVLVHVDLPPDAAVVAAAVGNAVKALIIIRTNILHGSVLPVVVSRDAWIACRFIISRIGTHCNAEYLE